MNMNVLQSVTPIKFKDAPGSQDCTYLKINQWGDGDNVTDSSGVFVSPTAAPASKKQATPTLGKSCEARKTLFPQKHFSLASNQEIKRETASHGLWLVTLLSTKHIYLFVFIRFNIFASVIKLAAGIALQSLLIWYLKRMHVRI